MTPSPPRARATELPQPTPEALAHSARVEAHLACQIADAGGWISFADYMDAVLYAPGLGYYAAGTQKFGAAGDFVTAPELSDLFGRVLAAQLADVLLQTADGVILELGAGSGRLAGDILGTLAQRDALPAAYRILEVSPDLRQRQQAQLSERVPQLLDRVQWIDALPAQWSGVVIANEVLDAVPPQLVVRAAGEWRERGVTLDDAGRLSWEDRPLASGALQDAAAARVPHIDGYVGEINLAAEALVASLAARCERGAMFIADYGFPALEFYHPQRHAGTLMVHYRHRALADPFFLPGLADITAHVDFSAIARAGIAAGLQVAGYTTQAHFLINGGILGALAASGDPQSAAYLRAAAQVQTLLSPAEMGELFKMLVLSRGIEGGLAAFRQGDRSHRL